MCEQMAAFFGYPQFLSLPKTRNTNYISSSSQPPSSHQPPQQPANNGGLLSSNPDEQTPPTLAAKVEPPQKPITKTSVDSTDWVSSTLTRRFGLGAGLAWVGFLSVGVVSEQIKTRFEVSQQEANTRDVEKQEEVVLPNGIRYYDLRIGGGVSPRPGDLVVIDVKGSVQGSGLVFVDTFKSEKKKPLALVMGSRPYSKGICEGIEYVLRTMKAGGKRKVIIPSSLGFGGEGADLGEGVQIPPFATLEYVIEVERVSIAPA